MSLALAPGSLLLVVRAGGAGCAGGQAREEGERRRCRNGPVGFRRAEAAGRRGAGDRHGHVWRARRELAENWRRFWREGTQPALHAGAPRAWPAGGTGAPVSVRAEGKLWGWEPAPSPSDSSYP